MHQELLRNQQLAAFEEQRLCDGRPNGRRTVRRAGIARDVRVENGDVDAGPSRGWIQAALLEKSAPIAGHVGSFRAERMSHMSALSVDTNLSVHTNLDGMSLQTFNAEFSPFPSPSQPAYMLSEQQLYELLNYIANPQVPHPKRHSALHYLYERLRDKCFGVLHEDAQLEVLKCVIQCHCQLGGIVGVTWHCITIVYGIVRSGYATPMFIERMFRTTKIGELLAACLHPNGSECIDMAVCVLRDLLSIRISNHCVEKFAPWMLPLLVNISNIPAKQSALWDSIAAMLHHREAKRHFKHIGGIECCIRSLKQNAAEKALFPTVRALRILTSDQVVEEALGVIHRLLDTGVIHMLANLLQHGSPQLLREIARLLRDVGSHVKRLDLKEVGEEALRAAIIPSLQLLGSSDFYLNLYLTGFLCNIATRLFAKQCIAQSNGSKSHSSEYWDVVDNILLCLTNVIYAYHQYLSLEQLMDLLGCFFVMLDHFKPIKTCYNSRRVVHIVNLILQNRPDALFIHPYLSWYKNDIKAFMDHFRLSSPAEYFNFLSRTTFLLALVCHNPALRSQAVHFIQSHYPDVDFQQIRDKAEATSHSQLKNHLDLLVKIMYDPQFPLPNHFNSQNLPPFIFPQPQYQ
ncbi:hypothetical protein M3Y99_00878200 [Aphelenchoides fujianensis]|nr:hypothetical protein M3Y99_00878200 [Aphelenchoides fujianensis]